MKILSVILSLAALAVSTTLLVLFLQERSHEGDARNIAAQTQRNTLELLLKLERRADQSLTALRGMIPPPAREASLAGTETERLAEHHLVNLRLGVQRWHDRVRDPAETATAEYMMATSRELIAQLGLDVVPILEAELVRVDESADPEDGSPLIRSGYQTQILQTLAQIAPESALAYLVEVSSSEVAAPPVLLQRDVIALFGQLDRGQATEAYVRLLGRAAPGDYNPDTLLRDLRHRLDPAATPRIVAILKKELLDPQAEILHRNAAAKELQYYDSPEAVIALKQALLDETLDNVTTFPHALRSLDVLIKSDIVPHLDEIRKKNPRARHDLLAELEKKYASQAMAAQDPKNEDR